MQNQQSQTNRSNSLQQRGQQTQQVAQAHHNFQKYIAQQQNQRHLLSASQNSTKQAYSLNEFTKSQANLEVQKNQSSKRVSQPESAKNMMIQNLTQSNQSKEIKKKDLMNYSVNGQNKVIIPQSNPIPAISILNQQSNLRPSSQMKQNQAPSSKNNLSLPTQYQTNTRESNVSAYQNSNTGSSLSHYCQNPSQPLSVRGSTPTSQQAQFSGYPQVQQHLQLTVPLANQIMTPGFNSNNQSTLNASQAQCQNVCQAKGASFEQSRFSNSTISHNYNRFILPQNTYQDSVQSQSYSQVQNFPESFNYQQLLNHQQMISEESCLPSSNPSTILNQQRLHLNQGQKNDNQMMSPMGHQKQNEGSSNQKQPGQFKTMNEVLAEFKMQKKRSSQSPMKKYANEHFYSQSQERIEPQRRLTDKNNGKPMSIERNLDKKGTTNFIISTTLHNPIFHTQDLRSASLKMKNSDIAVNLRQGPLSQRDRKQSPQVMGIDVHRIMQGQLSTQRNTRLNHHKINDQKSKYISTSASSQADRLKEIQPSKQNNSTNCPNQLNLGSKPFITQGSSPRSQVSPLGFKSTRLSENPWHSKDRNITQPESSVQSHKFIPQQNQAPKNKMQIYEHILNQNSQPRGNNHTVKNQNQICNREEAYEVQQADKSQRGDKKENLLSLSENVPHSHQDNQALVSIISSLVQQQTLIFQDIEKMRISHVEEVQGLKRKIADTEKRLVQLWELLKDSNKKSESRINEFQQIVVHLINLVTQNSIPQHNQAAINLNIQNQISSILQINDQSDLQSKAQLTGLLLHNQPQQNDMTKRLGDQLLGDVLTPQVTEKRPRINCTFLQPVESTEGLYNKQLSIQNLVQETQKKFHNIDDNLLYSDTTYQAFPTSVQNLKQLQSCGKEKNSELTSSIISYQPEQQCHENNFLDHRGSFQFNLQTEPNLQYNDQFSISNFQSEAQTLKPSIPYMEIEEEIKAMMASSDNNELKNLCRLALVEQRDLNQQEIQGFGTSKFVSQDQSKLMRMFDKHTITFDNSESQSPYKNYEIGDANQIQHLHQEYNNQDDEELSNSNLYSLSHTTYNIIKNRSKAPTLCGTQNILQDWKSQMDVIFNEIDQQKVLKEQKRQLQVIQPTTPQQQLVEHKENKLQYNQLRASMNRVHSQDYNKSSQNKLNILSEQGEVNQGCPTPDTINQPVQNLDDSEESSIKIKFQDPDTASKLRHLTQQICQSDLKSVISKVRSYHQSSSLSQHSQEKRLPHSVLESCLKLQSQYSSNNRECGALTIPGTESVTVTATGTNSAQKSAEKSGQKESETLNRLLNKVESIEQQKANQHLQSQKERLSNQLNDIMFGGKGQIGQSQSSKKDRYSQKRIDYEQEDSIEGMKVDFENINHLQQQAIEKIAVLKSLSGRELSNQQAMDQDIFHYLQQSLQKQLSGDLNEQTYFISAPWFIEWYKYCSKQICNKPNKIQNQVLLEKDFQNLRGDIVLNKDYFMINEATWKVLNQNYGADFSISLLKNSIFIKSLSNYVSEEFAQNSSTSRVEGKAFGKSKSSIMEVPNEYSAIQERQANQDQLIDQVQDYKNSKTAHQSQHHSNKLFENCGNALTPIFSSSQPSQSTLHFQLYPIGMNNTGAALSGFDQSQNLKSQTQSQVFNLQQDTHGSQPHLVNMNSPFALFRNAGPYVMSLHTQSQEDPSLQNEILMDAVDQSCKQDYEGSQVRHSLLPLDVNNGSLESQSRENRCQILPSETDEEGEVIYINCGGRHSTYKVSNLKQLQGSIEQQSDSLKQMNLTQSLQIPYSEDQKQNEFFKSQVEAKKQGRSEIQDYSQQKTIIDDENKSTIQNLQPGQLLEQQQPSFSKLHSYQRHSLISQSNVQSEKSGQGKGFYQTLPLQPAKNLTVSGSGSRLSQVQQMNSQSLQGQLPQSARLQNLNSTVTGIHQQKQSSSQPFNSGLPRVQHQNPKLSSPTKTSKQGSLTRDMRGQESVQRQKRQGEASGFEQIQSERRSTNRNNQKIVIDTASSIHSNTITGSGFQNDYQLNQELQNEYQNQAVKDQASQKQKMMSQYYSNATSTQPSRQGAQTPKLGQVNSAAGGSSLMSAYSLGCSQTVSNINNQAPSKENRNQRQQKK